MYFKYVQFAVGQLHLNKATKGEGEELKEERTEKGNFSSIQEDQYPELREGREKGDTNTCIIKSTP